jgi:hypothetical protein
MGLDSWHMVYVLATSGLLWALESCTVVEGGFLCCNRYVCVLVADIQEPGEGQE